VFKTVSVHLQQRTHKRLEVWDRHAFGCFL
jgi:hypothetical protein